MQFLPTSIHSFLLCITVTGVIILFIPIVIGWKFPFPSSEYSSINDLPIVIGIKSIEYKMSLISSISLSVHMVLDYVGHIIVSPEDFFSYRDSTSNLVLLIALLVPDLIQFFYIIPYVDYVLFHYVQYIRFILGTCTTLGYLSTFGGTFWRSYEVILSALFVTLGSILRFYSCYFNNETLIILVAATLFSFGIASIFIFILLKRWIVDLYQNNFKHSKSLLTTDQYCCNIYLVSFVITVTGLWLLLFIYRIPPWYLYDTLCLVSETMLFSVYYVVITVFQGRAAVREAAISKVSL